MPKRTDLHSILLVGSGPIIIGQACEFDYSGTQACKVLRDEGYRVILINSNPATIMTDPDLADRTYIEPITPEFVEKIIERERPDALLPTMGGQTALNTAVALAESGVLAKYNVELIGAKLEAIKKAEGRELFKETMDKAGLETPRGGFVHSFEEAEELVKRIGFPIIIRPSFTLGGTGGGTAMNAGEFEEKVMHGLEASPTHEVLLEESVIGWKEYELEVMRDLKDNVVIVCSIENLDPMGVHTGDSITVAPQQTLTDKEYQSMRDDALKIIRAIGVETGGSNIQFAVNPQNGRRLVIEMNPRVSRSSALASKATGFAIAKIATKLAVGYTLDEISNDITKLTPASFEPTIDYTVVKIPRWDFVKFKGVDEVLGVQMKSVGEAMAFGRTFKEALQKALRSLEQGRHGLGSDGKDLCEPPKLSPAEQEAWRTKVRDFISLPRPDRLFYLRYGMLLGMADAELHTLTGIDPWFLAQIRQIVVMEQKIKAAPALDPVLLRTAKEYGFSDKQLAVLRGSDEAAMRKQRIAAGVIPVFKTVDTCGAEFHAETPYHYSTYEQENESVRTPRKKVMILGGGPNRIGQGIEFDYCCVHGVMGLAEEGYETIMVNCNPETVSTDYDTTDKLYFEPLTLEDVLNICDLEKPEGLIVSFGGQTPLKLAKALEANGYRILGTTTEGIDLAEDRKRFGALLDELKIACPPYGTAFDLDGALAIAKRIGYPVLVRPSYVLGGRAMEICYSDDGIREYMGKAVNVSPEHPVLVDRFLEDAFEFDVDALCDGTDVYIGGIMQHIEEAGVHSGDSACVLPPYAVTAAQLHELVTHTRRLALALHVVGLVNIQYAMQNGVVSVLEVNPRASRTTPFVSKSTGVPLAKIAAKLKVGKTLKGLGIQGYSWAKHVSIKESVFPFNKFPQARHFLGPEMRSTGEVMGISDNFGASFAKAELAAGTTLPTSGTVFVSLNDNDKQARAVNVVRSYVRLGFKVIATEGTAAFLTAQGIRNRTVLKASEGTLNIIDVIRNGWVQLIINTPLGQVSRQDEHAIGRTAYEYRVPFLTTLSAAASAAKSIEQMKNQTFSVMSVQEYHELARQGGGSRKLETLEDCTRLVEFIRSFQV
ncbi:MAG: carbamoyl-phosphate synthase large subunit [Ignavibacteriae bacterium]|nr:carbamoyl-phosphate synthase large subunit [Ignavibacteriota bacterium]